ncbi:ABC transporter ATP-binding protein [Actinomadura macrotermitis]|uniref:ABC-type quaternary amine transporter n=1 Tax=Actinomadura macrotermitis TaxID=2585200 RepID=A0A7K0BZL8_9ACTN|nr:ABC transporter ATP-binding protein [Actinomadura macrotermitis]MQY06302.1 putative 2-aminoethylphosphonate import ATP-binding protein PhnT [Actinomadura macrotermitis]
MTSTLTPVPATAVEAPAIGWDGVSVRYGDAHALRDLTLDVARGETVALLGPSGSGKSTALKAVAGFVRPTSGRVLLGGRDVTGEPPHRRGVGVVVQSYALFPHMKVEDNVAFGLRARRLPRAEVAARVTEMLAMVGMTAHRGKLPRELSGGQQQRIAIARALAIRPPVLLLDEPLSALDARLRQDMLDELRRLRGELPDTAIVYVTHDQTEALVLADRIAIMRDARLVDVGPADELYHRPPSAFTAEFLGGANLIPAEAVAGGARVGDRTVPAAHSAVASGPALLCVRPHALTVEVPGPDGLPGRVTAVQWRGSGYRLEVALDCGATVSADLPALTGVPAAGEPAAVRVGAACVVAREEP